MSDDKNAIPNAEVVGSAARLPTYGELPWSVVCAYVQAAVGAAPRIDPDYYIGHQIVGINFNSLNRIMSALAAAPHPQAAQAQVAITNATDEGSVRKALSNALRECDTTNAQRMAIFDAFMPRWLRLASSTPTDSKGAA